MRTPLAARARRASRLTQQAFADAYLLDVSAVRNWEIGRREPDPAARVLLRLIEQHPVGMAKLIGDLPAIVDSENGPDPGDPIGDSEKATTNPER